MSRIQRGTVTPLDSRTEGIHSTWLGAARSWKSWGISFIT
jgi:hypothetical protein